MLDVVLIRDCSYPTCIVVRLGLGNEEIIVINAYFKYAGRIQRHIGHLERILTRFRNEVFLVVADVNARSVLWFNDRTDDRGEELEALILTHDLMLFSCPSELSSFENTKGQSTNIDVTFWQQISRTEDTGLENTRGCVTVISLDDNIQHQDVIGTDLLSEI